jgi:hypothetical protein
MAMFEFEEGGIQIDATIVAEGLKIEPTLVLERIRDGKITTLYERGIDEDEGRHRLTFFSESRRFRILVDNEGNVLQRSAIDFGGRNFPATAGKPGA